MADWRPTQSFGSLQQMRPVAAETLSLPAPHRVGMNQTQGPSPVLPHHGQRDPETAVTNCNWFIQPHNAISRKRERVQKSPDYRQGTALSAITCCLCISIFRTLRGLESFLLKNATEPLPRIVEKLAEETSGAGDPD